ncbi:putative type II secretion system protein D [Calidithermus terrae]|uniref:Putative type II secretion system protein D n=1 Tax=Calidithermus terrae TaxID=1408545 RepID=A0A399DR31_9DEIN|nr:putative type II secretion system protein D [Calidithermus terrae]
MRVGSGEAIVIGGLLENRRTESVEKVPGLGDLPLLGELFKTTSTTTAETDLVIVITPRLLTPLR